MIIAKFLFLLRLRLVDYRPVDSCSNLTAVVACHYCLEYICITKLLDYWIMSTLCLRKRLAHLFVNSTEKWQYTGWAKLSDTTLHFCL